MKILRRTIQFITVDVVHNLFWFKFAPEFLCHDCPVDANPMTSAILPNVVVWIPPTEEDGVVLKPWKIGQRSNPLLNFLRELLRPFDFLYWLQDLASVLLAVVLLATAQSQMQPATVWKFASLPLSLPRIAVSANRAQRDSIMVLLPVDATETTTVDRTTAVWEGANFAFRKLALFPKFKIMTTAEESFTMGFLGMDYRPSLNKSITSLYFAHCSHVASMPVG